MNERIYPIGIQNFEKLRQGGYVYVDKTGLIEKTNAKINTLQKYLCIVNIAGISYN